MKVITSSTNITTTINNNNNNNNNNIKKKDKDKDKDKNKNKNKNKNQDDLNEMTTKTTKTTRTTATTKKRRSKSQLSSSSSSSLSESEEGTTTTMEKCLCLPLPVVPSVGGSFVVGSSVNVNVNGSGNDLTRIYGGCNNTNNGNGNENLRKINIRNNFLHFLQVEDTFARLSLHRKGGVLWQSTFEKLPTDLMAENFVFKEAYDGLCCVKYCYEEVCDSECYFEHYKGSVELMDVDLIATYFRCRIFHPAVNLETECHCKLLPLCMKHIQIRQRFLRSIVDKIPQCILSDCHNFRLSHKYYCYGHMCIIDSCQNLAQSERNHLRYENIMMNNKENFLYNVGLCKYHKMTIEKSNMVLKHDQLLVNL